VTFNYDELLDRSLEAQTGNWVLSTFDSYISRPDWRLYKLHGSVGWSRVLTQEVGRAGSTKPGSALNPNPGDVIAHAHQLDVDQGVLSPSRWHGERHARGTIALPGIAVPTNRKISFECPPEHMARFVEDVKRIDRLLIIGWRAAEPHARQLLEEHIRPGYDLAICTQSEDGIDATYSNMGLAGERARDTLRVPNGFSALMGSGELGHWLVREPL